MRVGSVVPWGAGPIREARLAGQRPEEAVILSLVGAVAGVENPVVRVESLAVDFGWVRGLDVLVYYRDPGRLRGLLPVLARLTEKIAVWDVALGQGTTMFPVFEARGRELHYLHLDSRSGRGLKRWVTSPWTEAENEEFAA